MSECHLLHSVVQDARPCLPNSLLFESVDAWEQIQLSGLRKMDLILLFFGIFYRSRVYLARTSFMERVNPSQLSRAKMTGDKNVPHIFRHAQFLLRFE